MIIPYVNNAQFEQLVRQFFKEKAARDARLQHRATLAQDVRGRMAVIDMAKQRKEWFEKQGIDKSFEDCQHYIEGIANKAEKK